MVIKLTTNNNNKKYIVKSLIYEFIAVVGYDARRESAATVCRESEYDIVVQSMCLYLYSALLYTSVGIYILLQSSSWPKAANNEIFISKSINFEYYLSFVVLVQCARPEFMTLSIVPALRTASTHSLALIWERAWSRENKSSICCWKSMIYVYPLAGVVWCLEWVCARNSAI